MQEAISGATATIIYGFRIYWGCCCWSSRKEKTSSELSVAGCAPTTHAATRGLCRHSAQTHPPYNASVLSRVFLKIALSSIPPPLSYSYPILNSAIF